MNAAFFTSGEGFGHMARDLAVADELGKRGHRVILCTYGESAKKARQESDFEVVEVPRTAVVIEKGGQLNTIKTTIHSIIPMMLAPLSVLKAFLIIKKRAADVIIIDPYDFSLLAAILSGKPVFSISNCISMKGAYANLPIISSFVIQPVLKIAMALCKRFTTILICDYSPPNTIAKYNVEGFAKKLVYAGPMARASPEKLPPVNKIRKNIGLGRFILVTRGKYGSESKITKILEDLSRLTKKHTVVVMGDEDRKLGNLHIKKFDYREYLEYLKACDLVITHGGHSTMMECCIFGKPMILIVADNYWERVGNARGAEELGIAEFIPFSKLTATILHEAVDRMLKKKSGVLKFKKLYRKENGAERAADMIESAVAMEGLKRKQAQ